MDMRTLAVALLTFASTAVAAPIGPNLFIADDAFTIEQAMADAAAQRTPQDGPTWKLLVVEHPEQRLLASSPLSGTADLIRRAESGGSRVYVCAKGLKE